MGSAEQPSKARGRSTKSASPSTQIKADKGACVIGPALRVALNAPPSHSTGRGGGPGRRRRKEQRPKKDISKEFDTEYFRLDTVRLISYRNTSPSLALFCRS